MNRDTIVTKLTQLAFSSYEYSEVAREAIFLIQKYEEQILALQSNKKRISKDYGECPVCKKDSLIYDDITPYKSELFTGICYPWVCENCGSSGKEFYITEFESHREIKVGDKAK